MSFFDLSRYYDDFRFAKEMKSVLIEEVFRRKAVDPLEARKGVFSQTDDGREVRICLPHGPEVLKPYLTDWMNKEGQPSEEGGSYENCHQKVQFVLFVGYKTPVVPENLRAEVNHLDTRLMRELTEIDGMLAYVTGERVKGGDHTNLVLFRDLSVIQDLYQSATHARASGSVASSYYTHVRIHSGNLQAGLASPFFTLRKTLFLFFTLPPEHPQRRRVQLWRERQDESDDVKVLPEYASLPGE